MSAAMKTVTFLVVLIHAGTGCQRLGNSLSQTRLFSDYTALVEYGLLLDTSAPASCNGRGTAWNYCFYLVDSNPVFSQRAMLSLYRRSMGEPYVYHRVTGSELTVDIYDEYPTGQFHCLRTVLSNSFDVQEGDVVGACIEANEYNDSPGLDIIEEVGSYQLNRHIAVGARAGSCQDGVLNTVDIQQNRWSLSVGLALNINLEIDPSTAQEGVPTTQPVISSHAPSSSSVSTNHGTPQPTASRHPSTSHIPQPTDSSLPSTSHIPQSSAASSHPSTSRTAQLQPTDPSHPSTSHSLHPTAAVPSHSSTNPTASSTPATPQPSTRTSSSVPESPSTRSGAEESDIGSDLPILSDLLTVLLALLATGGVVLLTAVPVCIVVAGYCIVRAKGGQYSPSEGTESAPEGIRDFELQLRCFEEKFKDEDFYAEPAATVDQLFTQLQQLTINYIPRERIEIARLLGRGHFGQVNKGVWQDASGVIYNVAVKSTLPTCSAEERIKLLQEAAVMAQFNHPNVLQLYGVVVEDSQLMLVLELAQNGDLRKYLKELNKTVQHSSSSREITQELLGFSKDVAMGMYYLSRKGFVHRDIAARNVFLTATKMCKVADFGLSRELEQDSYYVSNGGEVPLKWTAPEALTHKKYSTSSDVWSYGCLLYEIWSIGGLPLEELNHFEVVSRLKFGYRMPAPQGCPRGIYEVMIMCWHLNPHSRPSFRDILETLLQFEETLWQESTMERYENITDPNPVALQLRSGSVSYANIGDGGLGEEETHSYMEMDPIEGTMEADYDEAAETTSTDNII